MNNFTKKDQIMFLYNLEIKYSVENESQNFEHTET